MNRKERRRQEKANKKQAGAGTSATASSASRKGSVASALMGYASGGSAVPLATGSASPAKVFEFAVGLFQSGRLVEAERAFRDVLNLDPRNATAFQLLGVVYHRMGRSDDATRYLEQAIAMQPDLAEAHHNYGMILVERGDMEAARIRFATAIEHKPDYADAHMNLGNLAASNGDVDRAREYFQKAIELAPQNVKARTNLAGLELQYGHHVAALAVLDAALEEFPDDALLHNNRGSVLVVKGDKDGARNAFQKALALEPSNPEADRNLRELNSHILQGWHFPMLVDERRNEAFDQAIKSVVGSTDYVLDIGAGSGLLSMMAARAGAAKVVAVERIAELAEAATRIVAANGYADNITVLAKNSTDLVVGQDMDLQADVVVSEILDGGLLGEGVIPSLRHAMANLARPGAKVVPMGAVVHGAVAELPGLRRYNPLDRVADFDLSLMNEFRNPAAYRPINLANEEHRFLSDPFHVATFDFANLPKTDRHRVSEIPISESGEMHGVVFWFDLHLTEQISVSTGKDSELRHWGQAVQYFDAGPSLSAGDSLKLLIAHTDDRIFFELAGD